MSYNYYDLTDDGTGAGSDYGSGSVGGTDGGLNMTPEQQAYYDSIPAYDPGYDYDAWYSDRPTAPYNPTTGVTGTTTPSTSTLEGILSALGSSAFNAIKSRYTSGTGDVDWANVLRDGASAAAAISAYNSAKQPTPPTGYQGGIPKYNAVREQVTPAVGARPGAGGQQYFTDMQYTAPAGLAAAQAAAQTQKTQREESNQARVPMQAAVMAPPVPDANAFYGRTPPVTAAQGGLMGYAKGGSAGVPRYLSGHTDGMADKIPASIDGKQPAALAHGEFVIPADVVSHLGNGNSDAGAQQLYKMMDKIRQARTGNKKQGKRINPDKFTPGGIAKYAAGGAVQHFAGEGASVVPAGTTGTESNLSNWVGPYVTDMLGKGQALSETPYQQYQGPLTAGPSGLQQQAFGNAAQLATPASIGQAATTAGQVGTQAAQAGSYTPTTFDNQFQAPTATGYNAAQTAGPMQVGTQSFNDAGTAAAFMSPYTQNVTDIQTREAQRQADIASTYRGAQFANSGAFGGSRQAIMDAEAARNLATQKGDITAQGLQSAYTAAQNQFNTQQQQSLAAQQANQQAGMQVGLANTGAQNTAAQFGAGQNMTAAQQAAQYGLAGQQAGEASKQFGANLGLQGLSTQLSAANAQGNLGNLQNQAGLANLNAQIGAGGVQQGLDQAGVAADQAAFNEARDNPFKMVQYQQSLLQGLPLAAQSYSVSTNPWAAGASALSGVQSLFGGQTAPTTAPVR